MLEAARYHNPLCCFCPECGFLWLHPFITEVQASEAVMVLWAKDIQLCYCSTRGEDVLECVLKACESATSMHAVCHCCEESAVLYRHDLILTSMLLSLINKCSVISGAFSCFTVLNRQTLSWNSTIWLLIEKCICTRNSWKLMVMEISTEGKRNICSYSKLAPLRGDKVSMLTHTYEHKPPRNI